MRRQPPLVHRRERIGQSRQAQGDRRGGIIHILKGGVVEWIMRPLRDDARGTEYAVVAAGQG